MRLRPINEGILVRKISPEQLESGIWLPEGMDQNFEQGEILDMGEGTISAQGNRIAPAVHVGDRVCYKTRGAVKFRTLGENVFLISERNIVGILEDD